MKTNCSAVGTPLLREICAMNSEIVADDTTV